VLNGKSVQIAAAGPPDNNSSKSKTMIDKPVMFTCFDCQPVAGAIEADQNLPSVVTSDQKGNIYVYNLQQNKYGS
jgi:hypothetical protein